ncbi:hypothetical protein MHM84_17620 [Halomonas sp. McH1-25]|uniref:hypothetical protein n=1 Tax=unclassified Halomonas TaxID=2609666 RepID=UPI001EF4B5C3|nr:MULTISPECIES: hypothetical protein [unclassified Halomonas]MCG7601588.1 hypothetical protein [Halomonas sp. McH1-25]MCP1343141.1 hypothetical protein [Halomonas sp. FL8]MCP1360952.1 hypothetical protein [Halomonas sp. BBD45]MCP1367241.1 hypothetical protein [Halomonas sp. BBD48]
MSKARNEVYAKEPAEEGSRTVNACRKVVGLVPAPEMSAEMAEQIIDHLPELLANYVDDRLSWEVQLIVDPLIGAAEASTDIIESILEYKRDRQWDYAICITDLPIYKHGRFVIAETSTVHGVAMVSLPAFGITAIRHRLSEAILQLVNELHHGSSEEDRARQEQRTQQSDKVHESLRGKGARKLLGRHLYEKLFPIRRITLPGKGDSFDVRFIADTWINGNLRILAGMVRANRPWTIFPAFKGVIAAAFATGAYGLVFPTLWQLSANYGGPRLVLLMSVAMVAMVAWIILAHNLWESVRKAFSPHLARLYNAVTVLTLGAGVVFYYAILLGLFCLAVLVFVPASMLESNIGHAAGLLDYIVLAWLATSVATIVGALGAGLEDEETVRNATYGYRQRRRNQEANKR